VQPSGVIASTKARQRPMLVLGSPIRQYARSAATSLGKNRCALDIM
jgi:hypothetical protein